MRLKTLEVNIGDLRLGNYHPIRVQTMTTTDTMDTLATVEQSIRCIEAGAELVRITAPSKKEAENLLNIRNELHRRGYKTPLVADIHFTPNAAEIAARIVEKVRVNPGNYVDFDEYVGLKLEKTRSTIRTTDILTALAGVAAMFLGYLLIFVILDQWVIRGGFGMAWRWVLLSTLAISTIAWLVWKIGVPSFRPGTSRNRRTTRRRRHPKAPPLQISPPAATPCMWELPMDRQKVHQGARPLCR